MPVAEHPLHGWRDVAVARGQRVRDEANVAVVVEQAEVDAGKQLGIAESLDRPVRCEIYIEPRLVELADPGGIQVREPGPAVGADGDLVAAAGRRHPLDVVLGPGGAQRRQ